MKIINKRKQKKTLGYYKKKLELALIYSQISTSLNRKQKDKLKVYLNRAIEFTKTMKVIEYLSAPYRKDIETIISSNSQYVEYQIIKLMLDNLVKDIDEDKQLNQDIKVALKKYISTPICHIRGKIKTIKK